MPILFNSVSQFEIQPERTKRRVKRDDLDTLTEIWTGPSDQEDTFVPLNGSVHPQYNLMTVLDTSIKRLPGSVSEVTIDYQGKLDGGGNSNYTSKPTIGLSWAEGEVSYQVAATGGTATFSRRYTGRSCIVAYISNRRPTGNPSNLGLSKEFLGFTNVWEIQTGFQAGASTSQGPPIEQLTCTDVKVEDRADSWYRVTETYQSRQFPGAVSTPLGAFVVSTQLAGNWNPSASSSSAPATQAGMQAAYGSLPSNTTPAGKDIAQSTGVDPGWVDIQGTPLGQAVGSGNAVQLADGSHALDY
jgi:hypothetical protein